MLGYMYLQQYIEKYRVALLIKLSYSCEFNLSASWYSFVGMHCFFKWNISIIRIWTRQRQKLREISIYCIVNHKKMSDCYKTLSVFKQLIWKSYSMRKIQNIIKLISRAALFRLFFFKKYDFIWKHSFYKS